MKHNTSKDPSMSLASTIYKIDGVNFSTLSMAMDQTGLLPEEIMRKCEGYMTDGGLWIPPAHRCKLMVANDGKKPPREVQTSRAAGFQAEIELPIAMPTWNRMFAMHHWERMKLRDMIHAYAAYAHTGAKPSLKERASMDALYLATIRPSKPNKLAAKGCKFEKQELVNDGRYTHNEGQEYNLFFYHYRWREADNSNLSTKAFEDAIVRMGVIPDDSAKYVDETRDKQIKITKAEKERTICRVFRKTTQDHTGSYL